MPQHEDTIRELVSAVESGDEDTIRDILADEIDLIGEEGETISQDKMVASMLEQSNALDGMDYTVRNLWHDADDDAYITHLGLEGTFAHPMEMRPSPEAEKITVEPNGEDVEGSFAYMFRFDNDGQVAEFNGFESPQILMEMGVIEFAPGGVGTDEVEAAAED